MNRNFYIYKNRSFSKQHCENCGKENPITADGYTTCCNEGVTEPEYDPDSKENEDWERAHKPFRDAWKRDMWQERFGTPFLKELPRLVKSIDEFIIKQQEIIMKKKHR